MGAAAGALRCRGHKVGHLGASTGRVAEMPFVGDVCTMKPHAWQCGRGFMLLYMIIQHCIDINNWPSAYQPIAN